MEMQHIMSLKNQQVILSYLTKLKKCAIVIFCTFFITCNSKYNTTKYFSIVYKDVVLKNKSKNIKQNNDNLYSFETAISSKYIVKSTFVYKYLVSNEIFSITNTLYKDGKRDGKYSDEFIFFDSIDKLRLYKFNINDSTFTYQIEYNKNGDKTNVLGSNLCNYSLSENENDLTLDIIYSAFGYESIKVFYRTGINNSYLLKKLEQESYSPFLYRGSFVFTSKQSTDTIYLKSELEAKSQITTFYDTLLRKRSIITQK